MVTMEPLPPHCPEHRRMCHFLSAHIQQVMERLSGMPMRQVIIPTTPITTNPAHNIGMQILIWDIISQVTGTTM